MRLSLQTRGSDNKAGVNYIFISLYLILLAFFILLTSISTVEKQETNAAFGSVIKTFNQERMVELQELSAANSNGLFRVRSALFEKVTGIFEETLALGQFETVAQGNRLQIQLTGDALFKDNSADLSAVTHDFMNRIAAALATPVRGFDYQLQFQMGVGPAYPASGNPNLPVLRGGAFARRLKKLGAPVEAIRVGGAIGDTNRVALTFLVRHEP